MYFYPFRVHIFWQRHGYYKAKQPGKVDYEVQRGDTLWKIAQKLLGSVSRYPEIISLNQLDGDMIYAGQVLRIPKK
ncbi:hypothetical protein B5E77_09080 [Lachnoclostridium sp. An131]|nr:hypothetical protein B5E77_09080 [Lachnoclostridium sp. An131]